MREPSYEAREPAFACRQPSSRHRHPAFPAGRRSALQVGGLPVQIGALPILIVVVVSSLICLSQASAVRKIGCPTSVSSLVK